MGNETLDLDTFNGIGVIKNQPSFDDDVLDQFDAEISAIRASEGPWDKAKIVESYLKVLPELSHEEKGKYLDSRM
jgi:ABC-type amino acid transport substrate-binding protein